MKPLARNHSERGIYDCSKGPPPPYTTSKSIPDESAVASRALVHPTPPHTQYATGTKPGTVAFQAFNQMIGTVQPTAQAQVYKPQQVHSSNEVSSQTQSTFVYKTISQPMCQAIPSPGRKQITSQHKGNAVTSKEVQQLALNGVVWMTTAGQMAQTAFNVHGVHSARMMQSYNPVVQNQNVGQSSKTLISIAPTSGSVPQISEGQGQLNGLDSQGNCNPALNLTANDFLRCNDQIQIQSAFRKEDAFQDESKAPSTVAGATPAQVFRRIWPAPTSYASVPAHVYGERARGDSSEWAGSSVSLSSQQNGQYNITNCFSLPNSNGQKRMVLARVTPMSHDWRNLQQNSNTVSTTDVNKLKNSQVEDAQLHHKLGSGQQDRTLSSAVSTFEKLFEKKNTTSSQLSAPRISVQRNIPIVPFVPPLPHKPSLQEQQSVQNIHFIYTPATVNEQCTVTSPVSSLSLKAQHNVTGPGNYFSISNISSKDPSGFQLSPLSARHGNFGVSSKSSDLVTQQTVTVSSVGAGNLHPNGDQSVLPPSDVPHSTNMLCSTFRQETKDEGKQSVDVVFSGSNPPPLGFNSENSKSSPIQLSSRDDFGKQSTAGLLLVVPPSVVKHNCQTMESSTVYTPPSTLTYEKDIPVKLIGGQVETCNTVVETPTSMLEMSKYSASSDANPSGSAGQHCEEMLGHGSSTVDECSKQQKDCANPLAVLIGQSPPRALSSSFELNGKKRNLTLDTEIYISPTNPTICEVQENLAVNNSPPPKKFLASALEDASQDTHGCKNTILCPDKESINSPELLHSERSDKSGAVNVAQADVGVKPEICITGVFSLGDDTGQWRSVQASSLVDLNNPTSGSTILTSDEVNKSSALKGLVTVESSLSDKVSPAEEGNTALMDGNGPMMCVPPSNLESSQCHSVTESPRMVHMQPVLESSFDKTIDQLSCDTSDPANILIDLTKDGDSSTDSALPSTLREHKTKLVSDESCLPFEVDGQYALLSFDKENRDLDGLLHSTEMAIETLLNFWNPDLPLCACGNNGMLVCKHNNLQGGTCESKLPNIEETALNFCGAVQVPEKVNEVDLLKDSGRDVSTDVKVLGHVEILNLLAEISKSNSNERLPVVGAESERFPHSIVKVNEETQHKASQSANSDESNENSTKVLEIKESRYRGEENCAPLQGHNNKNSTTKKGKQQEKKVYCCINAWLAASGVLGIYCNCKLSQGNKPESQAELPTAIHKIQSSSETSIQNCIVNQMEVQPTLNSEPLVTHQNVLELSEKRNSASSLVPGYNQEKNLGEVPQKVCSVDAVQQSSEVRTRAIEENEIENLCKPGNRNLHGFNASKGSDRLTGIVTLEGELDQKKIEEKKISLDAAEIGPNKEDDTVLEKEPIEDKSKNVRRDTSLNILSEKASDQTDALQFKRHIVKLGFKVMKRKTDSSSCRSPQKKRKIDVQGKKISGRSHGQQKNNHSSQRKTQCDFEDSKILPNYNCRIMIRDKTYSSSGEHAVLVSLLPISGKPHKAMEKVQVKT